MKELGKRFSIYLTRLFFDDNEKDFLDFIVIITLPIWGLFIGMAYFIIQFIEHIFRSFKNVKK